MGNKITQLKLVCAFCFAFISNSYAATYTAIANGNWSAGTTWAGGVSPGSTLGLNDNVVVGSAFTVNMDVDVNGLFASIDVSGTLTSSGNSRLTISQGTFSGNGNVVLEDFEMGGGLGATLSFSGDMYAKRMWNSALSLTLGAHLTVEDSLILEAGSLSLGSSGSLMVMTGSDIRVNDGTFSIGSGFFDNTNVHSVTYVGTSKTTGDEMTGEVTDVWVTLSSANQTVTQSDSVTVRGTMHHHMGMWSINGYMLILRGDYMNQNNSTITGGNTSDLRIESGVTFNSPLRFTSGSSSLNNLQLMGTGATNLDINSDLDIYGDYMLDNGHVNMSGSSTLRMMTGSSVTINQGTMTLGSGSDFDGTNSYNVNYLGASKSSTWETSGSGLNDLSLDMTNANDSVYMMHSTRINGMLNLEKGTWSMHGNRLRLDGDVSTTTNGWLRGYGNSDLYINTSAALSDTLYFANGSEMDTLSIDMTGGGQVMTNSNLWVNDIVMINGGMHIWNNQLSVKSTGSITGDNADNYIMIDGSGTLNMMVNSASTYVKFPVGTTNGYGAAHIQRNAGSPSGMVSVNTTDGVYSNGLFGSGIDLTTSESMVNRTWDFNSAGAVNVNMKLEWTDGLEMNGFDRNNAFISHYTGSAWDNTTASSSGTSTTTGYYTMTRSNITSFSPFSIMDINAVVGLKQEVASVTGKVYPVPATNEVTVDLNNANNYELHLIDALGNVVKEVNVNNSKDYKFDISDLPGGVYLLKIKEGANQVVKRIVKE